MKTKELIEILQHLNQHDEQVVVFVDAQKDDMTIRPGDILHVEHVEGMSSNSLAIYAIKTD